jgi:hypothetical protein
MENLEGQELWQQLKKNNVQAVWNKTATDNVIGFGDDINTAFADFNESDQLIVHESSPEFCKGINFKQFCRDNEFGENCRWLNRK